MSASMLHKHIVARRYVMQFPLQRHHKSGPGVAEESKSNCSLVAHAAASSSFAVAVLLLNEAPEADVSGETHVDSPEREFKIWIAFRRDK
jgi:hypothetical protein